MENDFIFSPIKLQELISGIRAGLKEDILSALGAQQEDRLLSPADACKLFTPAVSTKTLSRWTKDGLINVQRVGGRLYYKYSDLLTAGTNLRRYKPTRT